VALQKYAKGRDKKKHDRASPSLRTLTLYGNFHLTLIPINPRYRKAEQVKQANGSAKDKKKNGM